MKWSRKRLRALVIHNATLKLFSLAFACGLWLLVNAGERDTEKALLVPVELRNLPPQLAVVGPRVDFVDLRVSGPRTLLGRLDSKKITLDLAGVRPGPSSFRIGTELLSLPRGVKVVRISPSHVNLEIARIVKRMVPVRLDLVGKPPYGYSLVEVEVVPDMIEVTGPAPQVTKVEAILTDPVNIAHLTQPLTQDLNLHEPEGELITYSQDQVRARIDIQEVIVTREFRRLRIEVKNTPLRPVARTLKADVSVRGPQRLVEKLQLHDGDIFVDASGQEPGTVLLPVNVSLPPGIDLVFQEPAEVELTLVAKNQKKRQNSPIPKKQKKTGA
jgi:YbbR domain-containing protein